MAKNLFLSFYRYDRISTYAVHSIRFQKKKKKINLWHLLHDDFSLSSNLDTNSVFNVGGARTSNFIFNNKKTLLIELTRTHQ